eukprot:TRINITY_DN6832_c0_g1_i7.p1 TRINITY_DN6832_c0_g1~~TRINITY_DN6832_c0_g1_i7.p1  ORF type:complete len:234 (+),score=7.32 TRINITY_DN6832_c0_g1_i7:256-957(+)
MRLAIEFFRVILPASLSWFVILTIVGEYDWMRMMALPEQYEWVSWLLWPVYYVMGGLVGAVLVLLAKWVLIGRYRPQIQPLWSSFVWRSELVVALQECFIDIWIMNILKGSVFICWWFRCLGAKIGSRVYLDSVEITETDLVSLGDDVSVNSIATLQTHLFEDRVMKMSTVSILNRASIGHSAVILYDAELGENSHLNSLSLLMKGEKCPGATYLQGSPAQPCELDEAIMMDI